MKTKKVKKVKAITAETHEFLDRVLILAMLLEDHIISHKVSKKNPKVSAALIEASAHLAEAYQLAGEAEIKRASRKTQFEKLILKTLNQLADVKYRNGDISDLGNEIGFALGNKLKNRQELTSFLHGLNHGISLIDGTH